MLSLGCIPISDVVVTNLFMHSLSGMIHFTWLCSFYIKGLCIRYHQLCKVSCIQIIEILERGWLSQTLTCTLYKVTIPEYAVIEESGNHALLQCLTQIYTAYKSRQLCVYYCKCLLPLNVTQLQPSLIQIQNYCLVNVTHKVKINQCTTTIEMYSQQLTCTVFL